MKDPDVTTGTGKTVYRIGELAALTGTTPDTLRYYEREGLLDPPRRSDGGFRLYEKCAFERLAFIARAKAVGLTVREIRGLCAPGDAGEPRCLRAKRLLSAKRAEIISRIRELRTCERAVARALRDCDDWLAVSDGRSCAALDWTVREKRRRPHGLRRYRDDRARSSA